jgi:hypothetical protein
MPYTTDEPEHDLNSEILRGGKRRGSSSMKSMLSEAWSWHWICRLLINHGYKQTSMAPTDNGSTKSFAGIWGMVD